MKKYMIILAAALFALVSCESLREEFQPVFTGDYDNPDKEEPVKMEATHTIAQLASRYKVGNPWTIDENIVISGVISTSDRTGNFYKSFYIQDETGGMEIKMGKNGLYNDYLPGQRIYVDCRDLCLGMYGYKSGMGMVQLGYTDPSGEYETSYLESSLLIDTHVFKGEVGDKVQPVTVAESELPDENDTQANNRYVGKLVTVENLSYGWYDDRYKDLNEAFVLLYIDSNKNKKESSNRIFVSGTDTGITTWAMSKARMNEYLESGIWDSIKIGNANDQNYGTVGDMKEDDGSYPGIERAAASVSHYFSTPGGTCIQVRTSGYSRFADAEIPEGVLSGDKTVSVTGILALYQGKIQMVVNSLDDIVVSE